jgi:hypothetical protein
VPFAVESHGRLCKGAVDVLHMVAEWRADSGLQQAGKGAWLMSFYREDSCALQRGNGVMYAKSAERIVRAQGRHFFAGCCGALSLGRVGVSFSCEFVLVRVCCDTGSVGVPVGPW